MIAFARDDKSYLARWWWTVDRTLLAAVGALMLIGLLMTLSAGPVMGERYGGEALYFFKRQALFLPLAALVLLAASMLAERWLRRFAVIGFFAGLLLMALTPLIGFEANGARRWISLGRFALQPSEFVKPLFIVTTAWILSLQFTDPGVPAKKLMILPLAILLGLLVLQPDYGQAVLVSAVWGVQLAIAGLPLTLIAGLGLAGMLALYIAYLTSAHVAARIDTFIDPAAGDGYQAGRSLEAVGSGGLVGRGPGEGVVKASLPDAHTDYIFAVIAEEFGAAACLLLMLLYAGIIWRILAGLMQEENPFRVLAAAGLATMFGLQAVINIGVSLSLLPSKGMTLPFISYGGSSLLGLSLAMGFVLALTRRNRHMAAAITQPLAARPRQLTP